MLAMSAGWLTTAALGLLLIATPCGQRKLGTPPTESGGPLSPLQAAFDVISYDLSVELFPDRYFLEGRLIMQTRIVQPTDRILLDLDSPFEIRGVYEVSESGTVFSQRFERSPAQIDVHLGRTVRSGDEIRLRIDYGGVPRQSPHPPWVGGFVWDKTEDGSPWIGVACQADGADLWWPVKDHPSDEPDRMDLRITVPEPLFAAANGRLIGIEDRENGTRTFHWHVSNPINNYNVTLNAAPYREIRGAYQSLSGVTVPLHFWVLPEHYEAGTRLFRQFSKQLRFLEERLGPYPFRNEKYGVAESPYLGMEHQTIISYGGNFTDNEFGYDGLHFHELAHEWWGNLVSVPDWKDHWIHEGFASYMEALYAEFLQGPTALRTFMQTIRERVRNLMPVAPPDSRTLVQKYFVPPDFVETDGDVNYKGAWILHTLRYVIGDDDFFTALRSFAYPTPEMESATDGRQCRFVSSEEFQSLVEGISGRRLDWFFDLYLRHARLPDLQVRRIGNRLELTWTTPLEVPFPMPIDVQIEGRTHRVEMPGGSAEITVEAGRQVRIDPDGWVLKEAGGS